MDIPFGYCHCGCGEKTRIADRTRVRSGWVRGEPIRYLPQHHRRKSPVEYVVDPTTGCWVWQRATTQYGYGVKWLPEDGRQEMAHRVYYEQHVGPIPEGLYIDHLCRNPPCVNPEHLEPVLPAENVQRGLKSKITAEDVRMVLVSSESSSALARRLGVTPSVVSRIRTGDTWLNVPREVDPPKEKEAA